MERFEMKTENIIHEIDSLINYVYSWEEKVKKIRHPESNFLSSEAHPSYYSTEYHKACNQIINDLSELFFSEGRVNMEEIEKIVLLNLDNYFTRNKVATLSGLCVRSVRNKLNYAV